MAYTKYVYTRVNWKNKSESLETPLGKTNLNRMDSAIYQIAENVDVVYNEMDAKKLDKSSVGKMLSATPTWDADTGILTFQFYDGTEFSVDFNIEKIPVSFSMDSSGLITMTTADGTQWTANIADMIPDYVFEDSDTIAFIKTKNVDGSYSISADVKKNSLTESYFEPNYLSNVTTQASKAEASANSAGTYADNASFDAKLSQSYAVGGSGIREGEDTDNAKLYAEKAKEYADKAGEIVGGNFITQSEKGIAGGVASLDNNGKIPVSQIPDDISVNEMTGATTDTDGTSGTVPAPTAGQESLFLRGDGTWAEAKQDLSAYYNNAEYIDNKLQLKHDDKVLKEFEIKGSGGVTITPKPTVNPQIKNDDKKVIITWEDPTDTVIEGSTFSKWAGTKLVMKESGYPTSPDDGTLLVDNTTRDNYKTDGFVKDGLTNDIQYYFALFPYSTDGVYNYDSGNRLLGEPIGLKIVTFADGTYEEILAMIQAHYDDKINLSDYWAVGDTRSVSLSAMSATGVGESHRAQTVQFVIGDFEHDDLATAINGHTKSAITLLQKDCLMDAANASNPTNGSGDTERGYMNSSNTNVGGWKSCARRTWCNNVYFNALPSAWQSMVKTVNKKVSVGNNSSTIGTVQDKIFLAAEIEIFGSTYYSFAGEGTQYQYYKNATANRYKMPKLTSSFHSNQYWQRSPVSGGTDSFCYVNFSGDNGNGVADATFGVAPCLCI